MTPLLGYDTADDPVAMWDVAARVLGRLPQVVTAYLGPFALSRTAATELLSRGAALAVCANATTAAGVRGDAQAGYAWAEREAAAARALGVPAGATVFVDLEARYDPAADPRNPASEWIAGALTALRVAGYGAGVYLSLQSASVAAVRDAATARALQGHVAGWSAHWSAWPATDPEAWEPGVLEGVDLVGWQRAGNVPAAGGALDVDAWRPDFPGLWRPTAATPDVAAARARIAEAQAALAAAVQSLQGVAWNE